MLAKGKKVKQLLETKPMLLEFPQKNTHPTTQMHTIQMKNFKKMYIKSKSPFKLFTKLHINLRPLYFLKMGWGLDLPNCL